MKLDNILYLALPFSLILCVLCLVILKLTNKHSCKLRIKGLGVFISLDTDYPTCPTSTEGPKCNVDQEKRARNSAED